MSGKWVLDTNIILGYMRGNEVLNSLLKNKGDDVELIASVISRVELFSYKFMTIDETRAIRHLLRYITIVDFNKQVERVTITLRRHTKAKLPDAIILATAVVLNAPLYTFDRRLAGISWEGLQTIIPD
ncbi:MAG: type II toxin-antitoxin system VapC family toxin [Deltaproteobacteria bacterium]|jgi:predicted nucleic acid-binding protein|nr:type II toxin-antitoxin system VapC family toxin [Deltaproteobacteria bacterium]